ncbi:MAG: TrkH family potassium uptake protein [Thermoplasmatota archaeon]
MRIPEVLGRLLRWQGLALLALAVLSLWIDRGHAGYSVGALDVPRTVLVHATSGALAMGLGQSLVILAAVRPRPGDLDDREAVLAASLGWLVAAAAATLPFLLSGSFPSLAAAWFEATSGVTATGATALTGPFADHPPSLLVWRGVLQMGGAVLFILVTITFLARVTQGPQTLLPPSARAHSHRLAHRGRDTARMVLPLMAGLFAVLAALATVVLGLGGMGWGDAALHGALLSAGTVSTGGFVGLEGSLAAYGSPWLDALLVPFMLLAGASVLLLRPGPGRGGGGGRGRGLARFAGLYKDVEARLYAAIFVAASLVLAGTLWRHGEGVGLAVGHAAFMVASLLSTTGHANAEVASWTAGARFLLLGLLFTGGMAGSAAGGLKLVRVVVLARVVRRELVRLRHPRAVVPVRLRGKPLKEPTLMAAVAVLFAYLTTWLVGTQALLVAQPGLGVVNGGILAASSLGNVGFSFGILDADGGYDRLGAAGKTVLSLLMWAGRLEIFGALALFTRSAWRRGT